jgi:hypothetical protein
MPPTFTIQLPIQGLAYGQGSNPDILIDNISLEVISDRGGIQVNVLSEEMMVTRLQVGLDQSGRVVCKTWSPESWSKPDPDNVIVICSVHPDGEPSAQTAAKDSRDEDY